MAASQQGNKDVVEFLLKNGAYVDSTMEVIHLIYTPTCIQCNV